MNAHYRINGDNEMTFISREIADLEMSRNMLFDLTKRNIGKTVENLNLFFNKDEPLALFYQHGGIFIEGSPLYKESAPSQPVHFRKAALKFKESIELCFREYQLSGPKTYREAKLAFIPEEGAVYISQLDKSEDGSLKRSGMLLVKEDSPIWSRKKCPDLEKLCK